jgi:aminoglycoside 6'-N-acetyltransferase I
MNIRFANEADKDSWSKFRAELWPESSDNHLSEIEDYFQGKSIDIEVVFIAHANNDEVVGFLELNLRNFAEGSRCSPIPYIEAWYVSKPYRGKGVGKLLIQAAERWSIDNGYTEIASDTTPNNLGSIRAHNKLGYKEVERVVCFLKSLKNG